MDHPTATTRPFAAALLAVAMLLAPHVTPAATVVVAANGIDGPACGTKTAPCRTINHGIARAANGDTIVVGPGHYGDVNGDGQLSGPGEEIPADPCTCVISVSKPVTVLSRDGAGETIIDAGGAITGGIALDGVRMGASNAVLGQPKKGFTITRARGAGVRIAGSTFGVHVAGNRAIDNVGTAFVVDGSQHVLEANRAFANGGALTVQGIGHVIAGNLMTANAVGVGISGNGHVVRGNSISGTANSGMSISGSDMQILGNVAAGNRFEGFFLSGTHQLFSGNGAFANGTGLLVESVDATTVTITKSAFVGNGGCGLDTNLITNGPVAATKCFWGAPTGPGADPADDACNGTVAVPFATSEPKIGVKVKPAD